MLPIVTVILSKSGMTHWLPFKMFTQFGDIIFMANCELTPNNESDQI